MLTPIITHITRIIMGIGGRFITPGDGHIGAGTGMATITNTITLIMDITEGITADMDTADMDTLTGDMDIVVGMATRPVIGIMAAPGITEVIAITVVDIVMAGMAGRILQAGHGLAVAPGRRW